MQTINDLSQNLISHFYTVSEGNKLESVVLSETNSKEHPLLIIVHGHNKYGCWELIRDGFFLAKKGYIVLLPSQVGYGNSEGRKDFCGPSTVKGIIDTIQHFQTLKQFKFSKVGIWGISRGATVVCQILTQERNLFSCAVLQSGVYEMEKMFNDPKILPGIKENMNNETNNEDIESRWRRRSSIFNASKIRTPLLLLHGADDINVNVEQTNLFKEKLDYYRIPNETQILQHTDHFIGLAARKKYIYPFMEKYLR